LREGGSVSFDMGSDILLLGLGVEFVHVVFGGAEDLDFADVHILYGIDELAGLVDLGADRIGDEFLQQRFQLAFGDLIAHDLEHSLADALHLRGLGVAGLLDLVFAPLGKAEAEQAQHVAVGGLQIDVRLDQRLPFADERAHLVSGEGEPGEAGEAVLAHHLLDAKFDFLMGVSLLALQICQIGLHHASLDSVIGDEGSSGLVDGRESDVFVLEWVGGLHFEPDLLLESIRFFLGLLVDLLLSHCFFIQAL